MCSNLSQCIQEKIHHLCLFLFFIISKWFSNCILVVAMTCWKSQRKYYERQTSCALLFDWKTTKKRISSLYNFWSLKVHWCLSPVKNNNALGFCYHDYECVHMHIKGRCVIQKYYVEWLVLQQGSSQIVFQMTVFDVCFVSTRGDWKLKWEYKNPQRKLYSEPTGGCRCGWLNITRNQ